MALSRVSKLAYSLCYTSLNRIQQQSTIRIFCYYFSMLGVLKVSKPETEELIKWSSDLSVGIGEIDGQHKKLVALINRLHAAMRERKGHDELRQIIDGLIDYSINHFAFEEKYFEEFNYPETEEHKAEHTRFVKQISDFKKGFDQDRMMLSMDIMIFLKHWLLKHIQGTDKKYSEFFIEKGLS